MTWYEALAYDIGQFAFAVENWGIFVAYALFAWKVIPLLPLERLTAWSGHAFFVLCALTHAENALHTYYGQGEVMWMEWHQQLIHLLQVIAVWVFFVSFLRDVKVLMKSHNKLLLEAKDG